MAAIAEEGGSMWIHGSQPSLESDGWDFNHWPQAKGYKLKDL